MPDEPTIFYETMAAALQQGDAAAEGQFWEHFCPLLLAYFRKRGLTQNDAEDLFADCFLHIRRNIHKYNRRNFRGWVFRVAHNRWVDWLRKQNRFPHEALDDHPEVFDLEEETPDDLSPAEKAEVKAALEAALRQLRPEHREVFMLRGWDGFLGYEEIAARLGTTADTAKVWHHRARQKLQELLQDDPRLGRLLARYHRSRAQTRASGGRA